MEPREFASETQSISGYPPFFDPYNYSLAVTGDVFRWMVDYASAETFLRVSNDTVTMTYVNTGYVTYNLTSYHTSACRCLSKVTCLQECLLMRNTN
jgi:hypothetical protein